MPFVKKIYEVEGIMMKDCTICKNSLPLEIFQKLSKTKEHYSSRCRECDKIYKKQWIKDNKEKHRESCDKWNENNRKERIATIKVGNQKRIARKKQLPDTLTTQQWEEIKNDFGGVCPFTGSSDIVMEHFIPIAWEHGGTIIGNVYPLDASLNGTKSVKNPFEWAAEANIDPVAFNRLVSYLAAQNGLSEEEFVDYVFWCDDNKRLTSLEMWKKTQ